MMLLKSYNFNDKIKFIVPFKIITFLIIIWIIETNNDVSTYGNHIHNKFKHDGTCNASSNRLLAKRDIHKNIKYNSHRENSYDNRIYKNINYENDKPTYGYLKKGINNLESYKKDYNRRYATKKGLAKLDCYYEKKLFDKIDEMYEFSKNAKNSKKYLRKKLYKEFGYLRIFFSLLSLLGIIFYVLFSKIGPFTNHCFNNCSKHHNVSGASSKTIKEIHAAKSIELFPMSSTTFDTINILHDLFFIILSISVITVTIFTFIKVIKYQRLKAGKGKMNLKEYCQFCKDLINNKIN
ncbi:hypothetical protein PVIIG_06288 [Plasmodium vivax India VII]|uniref:Variable surface protein Vir35 n=1 Tax=Plasmodium vivax India VII TaxID=1077284 RepID=A0A0J9UUH8_PLAVI|nr:hypothetical protein PVIIG_06288 [Plasmodium vivax India VII]